MTPSCTAAVASYTNDRGLTTHQVTPLADGVLAWYDKSFAFSGVPAELIGATLLQGPKQTPVGATFTAKHWMFHPHGLHGARLH